jgi:protease PrsW
MDEGAGPGRGPAQGPGSRLQERGSEEYERFRAEFRAVRMGTVVPLAAWLNDRPWNLVWVRWFLFFALFPLALGQYLSAGTHTLRDVAWAFGIYFAAVWLVVLNVGMRPERLDYMLLAQVWFFTVFAGITLVLIGQQLPPMSWIYAMRRVAALPFQLFGYILGVGLLEEAVKALPLLLFVYRKRTPFQPTTYAYLGAISGLAFGVAEAVAYSLSYAQGLVTGQLDLGSYIVVQFTRLITLPLLHAMFSGIVGYFIGLAVLYSKAPRALICIGLGLAALLHGTYDVFAGGWLGVGVGVLTLLVFISYIRTSNRISRELLEPLP